MEYEAHEKKQWLPMNLLDGPNMDQEAWNTWWNDFQRLN